MRQFRILVTPNYTQDLLVVQAETEDEAREIALTQVAHLTLRWTVDNVWEDPVVKSRPVENVAQDDKTVIGAVKRAIYHVQHTGHSVVINPYDYGVRENHDQACQQIKATALKYGLSATIETIRRLTGGSHSIVRIALPPGVKPIENNEPLF